MKRPADIARATTRYNFHSHTQWCDGKAPIAEMTLAAIDAGMEHWGFTPPFTRTHTLVVQHEP